MTRWHFAAGWLVVGLLSFNVGTTWAQGTSQTLQATGEISTKEKLEFTDKALAEMQENLKTVRKTMDNAERGGDPDQIQCVRNKQASIQALYSVSERAQAAMRDALANGETERAEYEFRKLAVAISKVRQFTAEAQGCVGADEGGGEGEGTVDVSSGALTDIDDPLDDDTSDLAADIATAVAAPPEVSPYE